MSIHDAFFFFFKQIVWTVAVVVATLLLEQTTAVSLSSLPGSWRFYLSAGFLPQAQAPFPPNSLPLEGALGEAEVWSVGAHRK